MTRQLKLPNLHVKTGIFTNLDAYRQVNDYKQVSITCSGGRSSAYQLMHIIEANHGLPKNCQIVFCNTGYELEPTLEFVKTIEDFICEKINWIEFNPFVEHKVLQVDFESASRKGEPFKNLYNTPIRRKDGTMGLRALPNPKQRSCTTSLKIRTAHNFYMKILKWDRDYRKCLGYRGDEGKRVKRLEKYVSKALETMKRGGVRGMEGGIPIYPMFDAGVDSDDIMEFWEKMPFDLEIDAKFTNCVMCFMKSAWKIKEIIREYPDLAEEWAEFEKDGRDRNDIFRLDRPTIRELIDEVNSGNFDSHGDSQLFCGNCMD